MRVKGKLVLWPAYFDTDYTWRQGRRIPKRLALRSVKLEEIMEAAGNLGMKPVLRPGMAFPKYPWRKAGSVLVEKIGPKSEVVKTLARRMRANRSSN